MYLIEGETLPLKYDINELKFRRDEFRCGTTVKNGAREYIGGASYAIVLIAMAYGAGRVMLVDEQF
jgi:hypothetical protein